MRTTRDEGLKLEYGVPASTPLRFVLARADELEGHMKAAYQAACALEAAIGGEALANLENGAPGAFCAAYAAARSFSCFLDESGLREAGERVN